jgi:hypothetical protein
MAELLTLTTPVTTNRTTYTLVGLKLDWPAAYIEVRLLGSDGVEIMRTYTGASATSKLSAMNTFNFSSGTSMQKKAIQLLQADFLELAGGITGVPL